MARMSAGDRERVMAIARLLDAIPGPSERFDRVACGAAATELRRLAGGEVVSAATRDVMADQLEYACRMVMDLARRMAER